MPKRLFILKLFQLYCCSITIHKKPSNALLTFQNRVFVCSYNIKYCLASQVLPSVLAARYMIRLFWLAFECSRLALNPKASVFHISVNQSLVTTNTSVQYFWFYIYVVIPRSRNTKTS